ncbi:RtcB family protein, partial [Thomasclavelia sp.]|uniref:RtcB family protein n=1 Tax=Thomasclavelia sp. TaxID=3025757 RepID=UPI0025F55581
MFEIDGKYNSAKVFATVIEEECITQIMDLCNQKWLEGLNIAIMPDCHAGKGATIGTTITLQNKVSPSLVGVDISCGMLIIKIPNELNVEIKKIDEFINDNIPSGFEINPQIDSKINYSFLNNLRCIKQIKNLEHIKKSLGSLGGGNHFIEINQAANQDKYLVVHSGSRNLGKQVAEIYQD